jgi:hypothetical protein
MSRIAVLVVALMVSVPAIYSVAQACGDKFLMAGRGAKFQRAYASVYPGKLLIYSQPSRNVKTAIRDPQLYKALRQAGHTVSIIDDWTLFENALRSGPVDVVLVDVAEASRLQPIVASSAAHPDPMYIVSSSTPSAASCPGLNCRLKSSDKPLKYLEEVESVLKARSKHTKSS